jgi:CDP-diacylglycerol--glycerol-3-phosphate 3-phosphatidyltransferase/cardiolipin synthase
MHTPRDPPIEAGSPESPSPPSLAGFFSTKELLLPPNLVSALRLPLALLFPFAARSQGKALAVLALAGLTDVLDGWLARESRQVTATGAVLDPIADKVFALSVVGTLIAQGKIPRWGIPALLAREILEAPLLLWVLLEAHEGTAPIPEVRANVPGKLATVAQFAAVMAALELPEVLPAALLASAATGTVAGVAYWRRELARRFGGCGASRR